MFGRSVYQIGAAVNRANKKKGTTFYVTPMFPEQKEDTLGRRSWFMDWFDKDRGWRGQGFFMNIETRKKHEAALGNKLVMVTREELDVMKQKKKTKAKAK